MIVIIDNKDSFVWNLASYAAHYDKVCVMPNGSKVTEVLDKHLDGMIISPGPGTPSDERYIGNVPGMLDSVGCPVLGVCLGHQAIAHHFGGAVGRVEPTHGKASRIYHDGKGIYSGVNNPLSAGRYHSLAVLSAPKGFDVTARTEDGMIMGIRSVDDRIEGVQFHPESVLTGNGGPDGLKMIKNFVERCGVGT
ncbi:MAG TPA: aminodeoxychorismate/anthranilate synthase component II [Candidatus Methanofastidiosa archaeon]|nr:aminodeoxychorismate/anthranilate synthase component II [Candidatus Methanofastidiosa archaeon]